MAIHQPRLVVPCACGCGETLENRDKKGRLRRYLRDHQTKALVWSRQRPYGPSPRLGRKASAETRQRLSESHLGQVAWNKGKKTGPAWNKGKPGRTPSLETRRKISVANKGARSHLWRGGVPQRNDYINTPEWKILRKVVYARDGWKCTVCKKAAGSKIQCHHIVPVRHGGPVLLLENLASVCMSCHKREEIRYGTPDYFWADRLHGIVASAIQL